MSADIINHLQELRPESGTKLSPVIVKGFLHDHNLPRALVESVLLANGEWGVKPIKGISSLLNISNRHISRRVNKMTFGNAFVMHRLNTELLGGESYPILTAVLGTAAGVASFGGGLIFTAATTAISKGITAQRILARIGDEIWHVEEIGRSGQDIMYVSSFFIKDPFRAHFQTKGWLIHEERQPVVI